MITCTNPLASRHLFWVASILMLAAIACNAPIASEEVEDLPPEAIEEEAIEPTAESLTPPAGTLPSRSGLQGGDQPIPSTSDSEGDDTSSTTPDGPPTTTPTFDPDLPVYRGPDNATFELFRDTLIDNLSSGPRDYGELQTLMGGDVFLITGVNIAERELSPAEATRQLESDILPTRNNFSYSFGDEANIPALIGYDPRDAFPEAVYFLLTGGWLDGNGDGILIVEPDGGSGYRWAGVILDSDGFKE